MKLPLQLINSQRKTMSMQVLEDGSIVIRAPFGVTPEGALSFARKNESWLLENYKKIMEQTSLKPSRTPGEIKEYKEKLRPVLEHRVAYYAGMMGVDYGHLAIRDQKTRWGSCSAKGNLNFNWKLYLAPEEVLDYVIVHELAHRLEMNHSSRFWGQVERILPDYRKRRKWLKDNGGKL